MTAPLRRVVRIETETHWRTITARTGREKRVSFMVEGRKTQTRRILRNWWGHDDTQPEVGVFHPTVIRRGEEEPGDPVFGAWSPDGEWAVKSPYGGPGGRLWVRETHYVQSAGYVDGTGRIIAYRATEPDAPTTWTPSIHMPRWASRLTLEIIDVRVERLQEIGADDCEAEGVVSNHTVPELLAWQQSLRRQYRELWNSLNEKRGYGWDANPWVWVIGFRRVLSECAPKSAGPETPRSEGRE